MELELIYIVDKNENKEKAKKVEEVDIKRSRKIKRIGSLSD